MADTAIVSDSRIDSRRLDLAVRIAALLTRPIAAIDDASCRVMTLGPAQVRAMAGHPAFCAPLNRAVAESIGFATAPIDDGMLFRLASSASSRLAAIMVTAPMAEVTHTAWVLAAAVLSRRVRTLMLKADRDLARETLGTEGFDIATREVPVLYPALCELDAGPGPEPLFAAAGDVTSRREQIAGFGLQVAGRFFDSSEPILGELFARRVPPAAKHPEREISVRPLGNAHCEQVVKLVRRRQPAWSATIG